MITYTCQFVSHYNSVPYRVEIGIPSDTEETRQLTPAGNPVTIEEEGDFDPFVPVRTQTGYVSVVIDDLATLKQLIPLTNNQYTAKIYAGNTLLFLGFVQTFTPDFSLQAGHRTLKIPVIDWLEALKYVKWNRSGDIITFAQVIHHVITYMDNSLAWVYFQGEVVLTGDADRRWLQKKVHSRLFIKNEMTLYDVLSSVCVFFGWTCRELGGSLYFTDFRQLDGDSRALYRIAPGDLTGDTATAATPASFDSLALSWPSSSKDVLSFSKTVKSATVSCDLVSSGENLYLEKSDMISFIQNGGFESHEVNLYNKVSDDLYYEGWYYAIDTPLPVVINGDWEIRDAYNAQLHIDKKDSLDIEKWDYVISYYKSAYVRHYMSGSQWRFSVEEYYRGTISLHYRNAITADVDSNLYVDIKGSGTLQAVLFGVKNGNYYYNHETRQFDQETWNEKCYLNTYYGKRYDDPQGYISIYAGTILSDFSIEFHTTLADKIFRTAYNNITEFQLSLEPIETEEYNKSLKAETTKQNALGTDDVSLNTDFITKQDFLPSNTNTILNADGTPCESLSASDTPDDGFNPMDKLASSIIDEMSERRMTLDLRFIVYPFQISPITGYWRLSHYYYPTSLSYNYADDEIRIKMIERKATST